MTQKVSRNAEGHYEVNADPDQEYATYYMGITSSGGKNVEAQENPVRIGTDLKIYRASNTISTVTCPDIRYGETPKPELTAADTTGEIKYIYSSNENGEYKEWNAENKPGLWYVKAVVEPKLQGSGKHPGRIYSLQSAARSFCKHSSVKDL